MADIFISYSQKDRAIVAPLAAFLECHGFDVWWDTALVAGDEFRREIERQLTAARQVVVVWTANSVGSDWVLSEAGFGHRAGKLLPLRVAELAPQFLPLGFTEIHTEIESNRDGLLRALGAKGVAPSMVTGAATAAKAVRAQPRWMWWSTHESIEHEVPSATAIVETVLAVIGYWVLAIRMETYSFLLAGVVVAPLVLLRSDSSVALGVKWFEEFQSTLGAHNSAGGKMSPAQQFMVSIISLLAASINIMLCWWISILLPAQHGGWMTAIAIALVGWLSVGLSALLMFSFAGVVAGFGADFGAATGAVTIALELATGITEATSKIKLLQRALLVLLLSPIVVPMTLAYLVIVIIGSSSIRFLSTLRYTTTGLVSLPCNYRRLVLSTSPLQEPELVPGLYKTNSIFTLARWIETSRSEKLIYRINLIVALAYVPAWLYRISIKSTAWFWWPLAYIGREPYEARDPVRLQRIIQGSPFRQLGRWVAFVFMLAFAAANCWDYIIPTATANGVQLPALPEYTLVAGLLLNRGTGIPWQIAGLASAVIALFVGMWTSHAAISLQRANELKDLSALVRAGRPFAWIERLQRLGFLCTVIFWLGLAGHLALSANAQRCWVQLPANVVGWVQTIYGDLAPPMPSCRT